MLSWWTEGLSGLFGPALPQASGTILCLVLLEAVLSADNAVALAGIVQGIQPEERRRRVLNGGLVAALVLRGLMILAAGWVIRYAIVQLLGGAYLIVLAVRHFQDQFAADASAAPIAAPPPRSMLSVIGRVALTDLAFSFDSVGASVALTDSLPLVLLGGAMGVLMLRCLAALVIRWMDRFVHLANAAYLTVLAVGLRMLSRSLAPGLTPAEPVLLLMLLVLFAWGFSSSRPQEE